MREYQDKERAMANKYFTATLFILIATTATTTKPSFEFSEDDLQNLEPNQEISYLYMPPHNEINLPIEEPRPDGEAFLSLALIQALENLVIPQPSIDQATLQHMVINASNNNSPHSSPHTPSRANTLNTQASPATPNARLTRRPRTTTAGLGLARNLLNSFENAATEDDSLFSDTTPSQE